jgi:hypothetical protein
MSKRRVTGHRTRGPMRFTQSRIISWDKARTLMAIVITEPQITKPEQLGPRVCANPECLRVLRGRPHASGLCSWCHD